MTHAPATLAPYGVAGAAVIALASRLRARTARRWQHGAAGERLVARRLHGANGMIDFRGTAS